MTGSHFQKAERKDSKLATGKTSQSHKFPSKCLSLVFCSMISFLSLISFRFRQHNRIPNILGLIDCVVVKFVRPSRNEEAFYHHKHSHAMNVQVVCDDNHIIRNIRICPGSNNDRHVWRHSDIREKLQSLREDQQIVREEGRYYFLGDSGYTSSPIMLTPIQNAPEGSAEALYTSEHTRTRCQIEQTFGIYSNVWLAISRRRVLPYKPKKVALIILACAVLHNFRRLNGIRPGFPAQNHANNDRHVFEEGDFQAGILERQRLIYRYYV
ncbi:putative nuclease HARBI1 [Nasonia vitripennis]|uniref:DDE Tnp4 domain-containing protein n=1 Tax=Nasonia vitripennis TaxID=7425 RepID=A0A7M7QDJ4_NASVI|nr:putative nuclease HARBI1 [Nasonia vitripennis]